MGRQKIKNNRKKLIIGLVVLIILGFYLSSFIGGVSQPIKFNHELHHEQGYDCLTCHTTVETAPWASLPGVELCMMCHEDALTKSKQEEKIRKYAKNNQEIPWNRLFKVPDHVYFSHQRHVAFGKIECTECHGDMGMRKRPPRKAPVKISMTACIDCHEKNRVSTDCTACHR